MVLPKYITFCMIDIASEIIGGKGFPPVRCFNNACINLMVRNWQFKRLNALFFLLQEFTTHNTTSQWFNSCLRRLGEIDWLFVFGAPPRKGGMGADTTYHTVREIKMGVREFWNHCHELLNFLVEFWEFKTLTIFKCPRSSTLNSKSLDYVFNIIELKSESSHI